MSCQTRNQQQYVSQASANSARPIEYRDWNTKYITEVQMQEINDLFVDLLGKRIFNAKSVKAYLDNVMRIPEIGRTGVIDLKKDPITKSEAFVIIRELKKLKTNVRTAGRFKRYWERRILTVDRVLKSSPFISSIYTNLQQRMDGDVKSSITRWNNQIDGNVENGLSLIAQLGLNKPIKIDLGRDKEILKYAKTKDIT